MELSFIRVFFLPLTFKSIWSWLMLVTIDAIQAGKEVGLSERSVMYSLVSLATNKVIKKVKRGEYEKLQ